MKASLIRTLRFLLLVLILAAIFPGRASHAAASGKISIVPGWHKTSEGKYYYIREDGTQVIKSWLRIGDKYYYLNRYGHRVTGVAKVKTRYYYFHPTKGYKLTGWRKID